MAYLHTSPVCKEGCIKTCSRGKSSAPEGTFGGWICRGCLYNNWEEYKQENGEYEEYPLNVVVRRN